MWDDFIEELKAADAAKTKSAVETVDGKAVGSPVRNVDADTVAVGNDRYRLEGFNAPETGKFHRGVYIPGNVKGDRTQELVNKAAQVGGFTNLVDTGKRDENKRIIARQENQRGQSLGDLATATGIVAPNRYTSEDVLSDRGMINAMSRAMPSLVQADPVLKLMQEENELRMKEGKGLPLFQPKAVMDNEAQYAAAKGMVGHKATREQIEEIDRIDDILKDPTLRPDTRAKLEKQKEEAKDRLFFAGTTPDFAGSVAFRKGDRSLMNQAYDQTGVTWDKTILDMKKGLYGYAQMAGEAQQWDWLAKMGQEGVAHSKILAGDLPDTLGSIRDIRTGGDTWDTVSDSLTYVGNLMTGTLPYVGMMAAASLGAGVVAGGATAAALATLPSAMMYSGQFFADQPDDKKNPGLAVAFGTTAAVFDKVGLEGMIGGNIFSAVGRKEAVEMMIANAAKKGQALAADQAEEMLKEASKKTIMEMTQAGADFAAKHYASKEAKLAAIRQIGAGTAGETITETGQTILELFAVSGEVDPDLRYEKQFYTAILDAAIGGGVMGGAMTAGSTAIDMAQWGSAANAKRIYEGNLNDELAFFNHQNTLKEQGVAQGNPQGATSTLEAISKVRNVSDSPNQPGLFDMEGNPGNWNGFLSIVKDPFRMIRSLADTTVKSLRKENGEFKYFSGVLKSIMKAGILSGDSFDGFRQRIIGEWTTQDADSLSTELKTSVQGTNHALKQAWQNAWSKGERLQGNTPQEVTLQKWKDEVDKINKQAASLLTSLGYDASALGDQDTIFVDSSVDPVKIAKAEARLVEVMSRNGSGVREAREAVQGVSSGNPEAIRAGKKWMEQHGVFKDPTLNDLFEPNILVAFENFKHHVASDAAKKIYLGENGAVLAKLAYLAKEHGEVNEREYRDMVQQLQDFYRIATGQYNSLEKYPFIEKMLGWGVTATMLASLGKMALSSIPEIALSTMGTPGQRILSQLKEATVTTMSELRAEMNKAVSFTTSGIGMSYARNAPGGRAHVEFTKLQEEEDALKTNPDTTEEQMEAFSKKVKKFHKKWLGRSLFESLGFNDSGYNAQSRYEIGNAKMKRSMQVFASMVGLNALTNATRIATLSVAADILHGKFAVLKAVPKEDRAHAFSSGVGLSNEQFQSLKELHSWGIDVGSVLDKLDIIDEKSPTEMDELLHVFAKGDKSLYDEETNPEGQHPLILELRTQIMTGLRNMMAQRVTDPQIANLPKYYHDPRFRVMTTMTRFVASMTANLLPRLYRDYIKDGSTGMRYQAFSAMCMAVVFSYMANIMKDMLSYGDDDNPYIKSNVKKAQRALYGSGLLGRFESAVDTLSPLYPSKKVDPTDKPITYAYQSLRDTAPPIGWADRAVTAIYDLGTGNTEAGVKKAVKSLPLVGSFPVVANTAAKLVKE